MGGIMNMANLFVLLLSLAFINSLISFGSIKKFLSLYPLINSSQDLEEFKQMVRKQMHQTLVQIGLLGVANIVAIYGIITRRINLLLVIVLDVVLIVLSKSFKKVEEQARTLKISDANLTDQYQSVCKTWVKKAFPDF